MATTNTMRNQILPKLATMDGFTLAGLADSPENALKMLVQEHPEVVLLDLDFGGRHVGLDTAKMMQKTRTRAAIVMMVPDLDAEEERIHARQYGSSWSYIKKTTAGRVDILEMVLKSAVRGVQWVEPAISRTLNVIWKIAEEARELENRRASATPSVVTSPTKLKNAKFEEPGSSSTPADDERYLGEGEEDEIAPGIKTTSTNESETDGLNITSVSVGHGGIGQNVGKVRRTG